MKIALDISVLSDPQRTGIAVYVFELVKALLEVNQTDQFILFGLVPLASYDYLRNLDLKDYPNVEMKIYKMPARLFRRIFLIWQKFDWPPIEKLIGQVDIVHSFNWWLPPQNGGKCLATIFDLSGVNHPEWHQPRTTQLDSLRLKRILKRADQVLVISENADAEFRRLKTQIPSAVIYPAVADQFKKRLSLAQINKTLATYHLEAGYILAVGTIEPRKNLVRLIEAYLATEAKQRLVLIGSSGWKNSQILDLVKQHPDKIVMTGFVPDSDLPALYQAADLFVYPSLYEGFGIPVLEAMSSGVPVILAKNSSLPEVGGQAVEYVEAESLSSIASGIKKVLNNKELSTKFIQKERLQAAKFDWHQSAIKLSKIYHQFEL